MVPTLVRILARDYKEIVVRHVVFYTDESGEELAESFTFDAVDQMFELLDEHAGQRMVGLYGVLRDRPDVFPGTENASICVERHLFDVDTDQLLLALAIRESLNAHFREAEAKGDV